MPESEDSSLLSHLQMNLTCSQPFSIIDDESVAQFLDTAGRISHWFYSYWIYLIPPYSLVSNFFVIIILLQSEMRSSGINNMMTVIAFCDIIFSLCAFANFFVTDTHDTFLGAILPAVYIYLGVAFHALSIHIGVGIGFCRVMVLRESRNSNKWQTSKYALTVSTVLFFYVFIVSLLFLRHYTWPEYLLTDGVYKIYWDTEDGCSFFKFTLFINAIVFKLIPCILMTIFSIQILNSMRKSRRSRVITLGFRADNSHIDRSSNLIFGIAVLFLLTEFPAVIYNLVSSVFTDDYIKILFGIGTFIDFLTQVNNASTFLMYCFLSSKFRKLCWRVISIRKPMSTTENFKIS